MNRRLQRGCVLGLVFLMAALPGAAQGFLDENRQPPSSGLIQVQCDPNTDPECDLPPGNGGNEGQPPDGGQTPPAQREDPLDQDGDGILDAQDDCPTVWGQKPNGCPIGDDNATTAYDQTGAASSSGGSAAATGDLGGSGCLVINEVLWAGTRFSKNHQYIELRNRCSATLRLDGLRLQLVDKPLDPLTVRTTLQLQGTMSPQGYFLLVNNALAVSDVQPDLVADFRLLEQGMAVVLVDSAGNRISTANAGNPTETAWFAGQLLRDGSSFSMERNESENAPDEPLGWHTNDGTTRFGLDALGGPINGTPGHPNSPTPEGR